MLITYNIELILYNYGLHEKLISIIIKLRKGYFPEVFGRRPRENNPSDEDLGKITLSQFNNYGY